MICKCCGEKMHEGYIPGNGLKWLPKWEKNVGRVILRGPREEGFWLCDQIGFAKTWKQLAWYCPKCDMIVINCKENLENPWTW